MCAALTAPEELHYRASRSCQHLFITRARVSTAASTRAAPSPVREGTLGESPAISRSPSLRPVQAARRERPGREGGIVFAISSSREQRGSKIDDASLRVTKELL